MKKKLPIIILTTLFLLFFVFYFFDPLEFLNSYIIPKDADDILLCYYKADLGPKNRKYYIVNVSGSIKLYTPDHPADYDELYVWNQEHKESIGFIDVPENLLKNLKKININKYRIKDSKRFDIAMPEAVYSIVQDNGKGFCLNTIKKCLYEGAVSADYQVIFKCKSCYTDYICEFIDEALSKVNS